jgi:hypothetical protein
MGLGLFAHWSQIDHADLRHARGFQLVRVWDYDVLFNVCFRHAQKLFLQVMKEEKINFFSNNGLLKAPITLFRCQTHSWIQLKAGKWPCGYHSIYSASLSRLIDSPHWLIYIFTCNNFTTNRSCSLEWEYTGIEAESSRIVLVTAPG